MSDDGRRSPGGFCPVCGGTSISVLSDLDLSELVLGYGSRSLDVKVDRFFARGVTRLQFLHCSGCDLRWFAPAAIGDGPFYEELQRHSWYYQAVKPEYGFAASRISPGDHVLEVGCGAGEFAKFLPAGCTYRGLEFNEEAVRKGRRQGLDVVRRPVAEEAAVSPEGYDVVCTFQVLEHVDDPLGFLKDCVALVKRGGRLIVATPSEDSFLCLASGAWLNMPPHHFTRWTDLALKNACDMAGISVTEVWHEPVADYHADWHESVLAATAVRGWVGLSPALGDTPRTSTFVRRLRYLPRVRRWLARHAAKKFKFTDHGHTVCVVGAK